jgi:hypothetical protein
LSAIRLPSGQALPDRTMLSTSDISRSYELATNRSLNLHRRVAKAILETVLDTCWLTTFRTT